MRFNSQVQKIFSETGPDAGRMSAENGPKWLLDPVLNFFPDFFFTHRIWILHTLFAIFDVFGFTPIDFPTELRALEGSFGSLFSVFVSCLILTFN
jgi:hypothetical protein